GRRKLQASSSSSVTQNLRHNGNRSPLRLEECGDRAEPACLLLAPLNARLPKHFRSSGGEGYRPIVPLSPSSAVPSPLLLVICAKLLLHLHFIYVKNRPYCFASLPVTARVRARIRNRRLCVDGETPQS